MATNDQEGFQVQAIDDRGNPVDTAVFEEAGVAFDPGTMHVDLTKAEKRRTTALMLAIQAYKNLLIPDAAYLNAVADLARRDEGPKIQPATINGVVLAAIQFDAFIAGQYDAVPVAEPDDGGRPSQHIDQGTGAPDVDTAG